MSSASGTVTLIRSVLHRAVCIAMLAAIAVTVGMGGEAWAQGGMPHGSTYRRPAVSPYTMLAQPGAAGAGGGVSQNGTFNPLVYQQLIQPRFDQESGTVTQMQQGRQLNNLQGRVQQIQRDTSSRQINETIRSTGHTATFQNLSHFYPGGR
jgi:TolA-binding protein